MDLNKSNYEGWHYGNATTAVPKVEEAYVARYVSKVYAWMFLGLMVTALAGFFGSQSTALLELIVSNKILFFGIFIAQIALVGFLSVRINKMSYATAVGVFLLYALLNGLVFTIVFFAFSASSLITVFAITAGTFGIMSAVGYYTKQDLTKFGRIMLMGLLGVVIASVVNFFMESSTLQWIISYVGVAVFVGLIAYDTQKIKSYAYIEDAEMRKKASIMGALSLYLDFINLFLLLLRFFGGSRD